MEIYPTLIKNLQNRTLFDHRVTRFRVIETHISWVLLTGPYAYKIKKPVKFDFADFSTLTKRKFFCEEEIKLNKRLSAFLYKGLIPITGSVESPRLNGNGATIEYAIKMVQFEQNKLFTHLALKGKLSPGLIEKLADNIAHFHQHALSVKPHSHYGSLENIAHSISNNFKDCYDRVKAKALVKKLALLEKASTALFVKLKNLFRDRKKNGFIKECHGDLHLGNIVLLHTLPTVFDCIEFNPDFRYIDVINEIAFLSMDLKDKKLNGLAYHFINEYMMHTGDYEGLQLLPFYEVYRAMVRAKVALYTNKKDSLTIFKNYLELAFSILNTQRKKPTLFITVGVSGSGKTKLSKLLAASLPAIHIRSDTERKRLFPHLSPPALYARDISQKTYDRLLALSVMLLQSGHSVIVDATFLEKRSRTVFKNAAEKLGLPFLFLEFEAHKTLLKRRIITRLSKRRDNSDATLEVLEKQLENRMPLDPQELKNTVKIDANSRTSISGFAHKIKRKIHRLNI